MEQKFYDEGLSGPLPYNLAIFPTGQLNTPLRGMSVSVRLNGARRMVGHVCLLRSSMLVIL